MDIIYIVLNTWGDVHKGSIPLSSRLIWVRCCSRDCMVGPSSVPFSP